MPRLSSQNPEIGDWTDAERQRITEKLRATGNEEEVRTYDLNIFNDGAPHEAILALINEALDERSLWG